MTILILMLTVLIFIITLIKHQLKKYIICSQGEIKTTYFYARITYLYANVACV